HMAGTIGALGRYEAYTELLQILRTSTGRNQLDDCQRIRLDVNGDRKIDISDLIVSLAYVSKAKGMAPEVDFWTYDLVDDSAEMAVAVRDHKIRVSNHSYSPEIGWEIRFEEIENGYGLIERLPYWMYLGNRDEFGRYTTKAREWDRITRDTGLLIFKSTGNHRYDGPDMCGLVPTCLDGLWDCIDPMGSAKNVVTVGALTDDGQIQRASGTGPVDDGRIKPDVVANGYEVYSTGAGNCYYNSMTPTRLFLNGIRACADPDVQEEFFKTYDRYGSSNACAAATGVGALMAQIYEHTNRGVKAAPETIKACVIHGAWHRDGIKSPDYARGFGEIDAEKTAGILLKRGYLLGTSRSGLPDMRIPIVTAPGATDLKVTTVWTDPPGDTLAKFSLVNDIDTELISPSGKKYYPWALDRFDPNKAATNSANNKVDNVEQIYVPADKMEAGQWVVVVKPAKITTLSQDFTMIVEGVQPIRVTKTFRIYNDAYPSTIPGVPDPNLIITAIRPETNHRWLKVTIGGKTMEELGTVSIPPQSFVEVVVEVDFAFSPEGQTALLTVESNDTSKEAPKVFIITRLL
ncbi:MAG TPA: S8 family serine peptidase, partial [Candidatus Sumerlaeota bacterium]|nr:S8 family serine peptidase [Candidatus Sumerlaeota bacterium]